MRVATMSSWLAKLKTHLGHVAAITTSVTVIVIGLGTVAKPFTEPFLQIPQKLENFGQRLGQVELAVDELRPPIRVAVYDEIGSSIFAACGYDIMCKGQYKIKRTDIGISCGRPEISGAFVINHGGRRWAVSNYDVEPVRADDEWVIVPFAFVPPSNALPGAARFFFSMEYRNCVFAATGVVVENTLRLPFIISRAE
jgi:hypothetical protein